MSYFCCFAVENLWNLSVSNRNKWSSTYITQNIINMHRKLCMRKLFEKNTENFRKFAKNSRRKLQKLLYFRLFCKEIFTNLWKFYKSTCVKFLRVWTKNTIGWENFEKIFENLKKIPEENCKNAVFSPILQRNYKIMR